MYCLLNMKKSQNQKIFSTISRSLNPSVAILCHTEHRNERFPTLLDTFASEIPTLSYT